MGKSEAVSQLGNFEALSQALYIGNAGLYGPLCMDNPMSVALVQALYMDKSGLYGHLYWQFRPLRASIHDKFRVCGTCTGPVH